MNIVKAWENADIITRILKLNADLFANYISRNFNYCLEEGELPSAVKHTDAVLVHKKIEEMIEQIMDRWSSSPIV